MGLGDIFKGAGEQFLGTVVPGYGYSKAAQGADAAQNEYKALAQDVWGKSQQGLQKAQQAYAPAGQAWQQYMNGYGYQPGQNAFDTYGRQFMNSGQQEGYVQNLRNQWQQPTYAQGAYGYTQGLAGSQGYQGDIYTQNAYKLQQPSATDRQYEALQRGLEQTNQNYYSTLGAAQNILSGRDAAATAEDANKAAQNMARLQHDSSMARAQMELGARGGVSKYENESAGNYRGANYLQQWAGNQGRGYDQTSGIESFANQLAATGTNDYLERERSKGNARINQEMARRGGFNSGGAMAALGNYNAELDAQKFKYAADTLQQGQQAKMQRLQAGQGLAQGVSGEQMARGQALQGLGQSLSNEQVARSGANVNIGNAQASFAQQQQALALQAAGQTAQSDLARASLQAQMADQQFRNGLAGQQFGMQAAGMVDQGQQARLAQMFGMGGQLDARQMQLASMMGGQAQGIDQGMFQRQAGMAGLLGGVDAYNRQGLAGYMGAGATAQGLDLASRNAMLQGGLAYGAGNAGLVGQFYGMGMQPYYGAMEGSINAGANASQLRGLGMLQNSQMAWNLAAQSGMLGQGPQQAAGAGGGGGAPGGLGGFLGGGGGMDPGIFGQLPAAALLA